MTADSSGSPTIRALSIVGLALGLAPASAQQPPPDAGGLQRQIEPAKPQALPKPKPPESDGKAMRKRAATQGPSIIVTRFEFEGNQRFSAAQLEPQLTGFLNRPLTLADLEQAAALLAQYIRAAGWLARVLVPPQQVSKGVIKLQVVEAHMGEARFTIDTPQDNLAIPPQELRAWLDASLPQGEAVNLRQLERGLLLMDDLPGVSVKGSEAAGQGEGVTDILLQARNTEAIGGEIGLDVLGTPDTGRYRLLARLGWNNSLGLGDQYVAMTLLSEGTRYLHLSGALPLGHQGMRGSLLLSGMHYRVVDSPQFDALQARGHSSAVGVQLSYPLIRSNSLNLYLSGDLEFKRYLNRSVAGISSDYQIRNAILKGDLNFFDGLGGGAVNLVSLSLVNGEVDLDGSPSQTTDAVTVNTQGGFHVLRYRLARSQVLNDRLSLVLAFSGQQASRNLDSAEKFFGGGASAVRAYAQGSGPASEAQMLNLETRWRIAGCSCEASLYYDWMRGRVNKSNNFSGAPALNEFALRSVGVGLSGDLGSRWRYTLALARELGRDPFASGSNQQDKDRNQANFSLSVVL